MNRFAPNHAGCRLVGELSVVRKAECLIERHGCLEVADRQIYKNHFGHLLLRLVDVGFQLLIQRCFRYDVGPGTITIQPTLNLSVNIP